MQSIRNMAYSQKNNNRDQVSAGAAILIDYGDLYRKLPRNTSKGFESMETIFGMIEALRRDLREKRRTRTNVVRAYADFASMNEVGSHAQRMLYMKGIEPLYVPNAGGTHTVELQLCVDAMDLLHHRSDLALFVLLTGKNAYLPLVQKFRQAGRKMLVVALDKPIAGASTMELESDWFMPAQNLIGGPPSGRTPSPTPPPIERMPRPPTPAEEYKDDRPFEEFENPMLLRTLEIIDDHFGQYDEVYLTPLLRKLSDLVDERRYDPKHLISDLVRYRAVRLEKRSGFPHDYTVLILENHHPVVARVLAESKNRNPYSSYSSDVGTDRDAPSQSEGYEPGELEGEYETGSQDYHKRETGDYYRRGSYPYSRDTYESDGDAERHDG